MKWNTFKPMLGGICLATILMSASSAKAILITAGTTVPVLSGDHNSQAAIEAILAANSIPLPFIYKQDVGSPDSGAFASSYSTTFGDPLLIDEDFTITFGGGNKITANPVYLLVKDGNASPNWYLYDISGWNGTEVIQGQGFFPAQGGISHVSIYGDDDDIDETPVPDGGSTIALLGFALVGADYLRRRLVKA